MPSGLCVFIFVFSAEGLRVLVAAEGSGKFNRFNKREEDSPLRFTPNATGHRHRRRPLTGRTDSGGGGVGGTATYGTQREHGGGNNNRLGTVATINQRGATRLQEHHFAQVNERARNTSDELKIDETENYQSISVSVYVSIYQSQQCVHVPVMILHAL
uniref:Secreted protein n=1 Tax=Larimichthys crocea TaxID=215358 RepID=A0A0F8ADK5_LARCR